MDHRKELSKAYKERVPCGCIYKISNTVNGNYIIGYAADMKSVENHFQFAMATGSTIHPKLKQDWLLLGSKAFTLEMLETLEKRPEQSQAEFIDDLKTLEALWSAQLERG
ncbi:GIY-YIG nuclease family protein [Tengunoibacter tsumagoiensis]|uniref:GIY-YIG domain-containing protein n=1 Tax=Tengunoibacter tsumagoiensis TaxID=2014871 RepID=A0A402A8A5_9CHLR|nr:GIY-YIG nuclease family protein [Tengunoibacter tsumagoiensis]GCE15226.1 hypothetical protein KTT_50850 [Tengunoibacter tsumagoiensis]